ncbi:MAG: zinc dependent phospholipase C family protein [Agathobacter sp.]|nr:zinc dependent phospholipase C family protein [Agathobacter sp.]
MPGFATHYLFGVDAYKKLTSRKLSVRIARNHHAYALGLQGPDIFFYFLPSYLLHKENIGSLAQSSQTGEFFSHLLESRLLFTAKPKDLAVADAYILGFMGHYSLDCTAHPYVYAFTGYDPKNPKSNVEYFGKHAYFEVELDNTLIYRKKHIIPSRFKQSRTIALSPRQRRVIAKMLNYTYRNTYPGLFSNDLIMRSAPYWMLGGLHIINDPSGQKKVLLRWLEQKLIHHAFLSPMLPSDRYHFIPDPLNLQHKKWTHPWTGESFQNGFLDLYKKALKRYLDLMDQYENLLKHGFSEEARQALCLSYGNRSFLSGEPL